MSNLTEGLIYITIGAVVVMFILAMLALFVELIIFVDNRIRAREKSALSHESDSDPGRIPVEAVVAIGLGLHQFFIEDAESKALLKMDRPRISTWSASGRFELMSSRLDVTTHPKQR